jgi:hypothetical protein
MAHRGGPESLPTETHAHTNCMDRANGTCVASCVVTRSQSSRQPFAMGDRTAGTANGV